MGGNADHRQVHGPDAVPRSGRQSGPHHRRWVGASRPHRRVPAADVLGDASGADTPRRDLRPCRAALLAARDRPRQGEAMSWQDTAKVRAWALRYVFLLYFVKPAVLEVSEERCEVVIPLNWRTRNHLKSMYFGALCIGADVSGGLIAFHLMGVMKVRLSFVFKAIRAEFLKRPEDDVHFVCEDGEAIQALVRRAVASGEREETTVHVTARVPKKLGEEPVARFEMMLSVKLT